MQLVLAHASDAIARRIAATLGARVVTPRDLSRRGWRHDPTSGTDDTLPIDDAIVPARAVSGVVTRIASVSPGELSHIVAEDREYIAAEMTAFLLSFLGSLACPVINAPTAGALNGPGWNEFRWRAAAVRAGFSTAATSTACTWLAVVGARVFGDASDETRAAARALADLAGMELLCVGVEPGRLEEPVYASIDLWRELPDDAIESIGARFSRGSA